MSAGREQHRSVDGPDMLDPYDVDRMGWEDGDVICGLTVRADEKVNTGMLRVECDAEPTAPASLSVEAEKGDLVHA